MCARMPNLRRRIEALEERLPPPTSLPPQRDPEEYLEIMHLAELRLTPEDREISERLRQRGDPNGDITDREYVAARAYLNAVSLECRRAGHRSIDALLAAYGGSQ